MKYRSRASLNTTLTPNFSGANTGPTLVKHTNSRRCQQKVHYFIRLLMRWSDGNKFQKVLQNCRNDARSAIRWCCHHTAYPHHIDVYLNNRTNKRKRKKTTYHQQHFPRSLRLHRAITNPTLAIFDDNFDRQRKKTKFLPYSLEWPEPPAWRMRFPVARS